MHACKNSWLMMDSYCMLLLNWNNIILILLLEFLTWWRSPLALTTLTSWSACGMGPCMPPLTIRHICHIRPLPSWRRSRFGPFDRPYCNAWRSWGNHPCQVSRYRTRADQDKGMDWGSFPQGWRITLWTARLSPTRQGCPSKKGAQS